MHKIKNKSVPDGTIGLVRRNILCCTGGTCPPLFPITGARNHLPHHDRPANKKRCAALTDICPPLLSSAVIRMQYHFTRLTHASDVHSCDVLFGVLPASTMLPALRVKSQGTEDDEHTYTCTERSAQASKTTRTHVKNYWARGSSTEGNENTKLPLNAGAHE